MNEYFLLTTDSRDTFNKELNSRIQNGWMTVISTFTVSKAGASYGNSHNLNHQFRTEYSILLRKHED